MSASIGEGLIFDMRTKVFAHVQRMPLAFFTRTQTGALVTRLNNDVLGAQEAFTDVLGTVVSNLISVALVLVVMFFLSWQLTLVSLIILPVFVLPARWLGRRLQGITREAYGLNAQMNTTMTERFNVAGALLVKLFGRPGEETQSFDGKAGRVRDIGVTQAMYARFFFVALTLTASLATALVYGWGGVLAVQGALTVGTVVALTAYLSRLYGPLTSLSNINVDIMTALVSFERVFEVLDLPPMIDEKPDAVAIPRGPARVQFDHVGFSYPTADEVSLASLESVATLDRTQTEPVLLDVSFDVNPGEMVGARRPVRCRQDDASAISSRGSTTCGAARSASMASTSGTRRSTRCATRSAWSPRTRTCSTSRSARTCLYARPDATRRGAHRGAARRADPAARREPPRRARHARRRPRLPPVRR